jgi:hypothetical protein
MQCIHCQSLVEIPKLGELRRLPTEGESEVNRRGRTTHGQSPNRTKGWLFSGGLVIAVMFAAAGFALLNYANSLYHNVTDYTNRVEQVSGEVIDAMKPSELWDWWGQVNQVELGEWQENSRVGSNIQSAILKKVAYALFAISGVGVISILSSFAVGKK